ncbi:MAG: MFS transporter [Thermodesulfobacteriota bacterium]|nr:MFS transporter [Thermodesulfobacteriota bacterium]
MYAATKLSFKAKLGFGTAELASSLTWTMFYVLFLFFLTDEFKSGQRREGLYFGVISFSRKISVAIAVWLVGIILSWIGYVPDAQQIDTAIFGIRMLYAEVTALFLFVSIIMAYLLPMTKAKHQALREAIELKKAGKPWDEETIKDIL